MPHGLLNSPSPLPALPHWATSLPSGVNTWRRLLPLSTTIRLPLASQTMPAGPLQFAGAAAGRAPLADEFALRVENGNGALPFVRHIHLAVLADRDAERPDALPSSLSP